MKKKIIVLITATALIAGIAFTAAELVRTAPSRCQEPMFQSSSAFGSAPRRYFEIQQIHTTWSALFPLTEYMITFQQRPVLRVSVSSLSCLKISDKKVSPEEAESLYEENIQNMRH